MSVEFKNWIKIRQESLEDGEKLCYCGHTYKCTCGDPDETLFNESVSRGALDPTSKTNNWGTE